MSVGTFGGGEIIKAVQGLHHCNVLEVPVALYAADLDAQTKVPVGLVPSDSRIVNRKSRPKDE